jgi:hypothetical protein
VNDSLKIVKAAMRTYVVSPILTPWAIYASPHVESRADGWRVVVRLKHGDVVDQLPTEAQALERAADLNAQAVLDALKEETNKGCKQSDYESIWGWFTGRLSSSLQWCKNWAVTSVYFTC